MQTILQLSDFHIKESMPQPKNNVVFTSLITFLKKLNLERPILLYNGDVIDTEVIKHGIDETITIEEKAKVWDTRAERAYGLAKEYFDYFTSELDISNERIIVCCGNHDVNPYYEGTEQLDCPDPKKKVHYHQKRFDQFAKFCDSIQLRKNTWATYFREIDGINFLVLNTNWINKWGASGRQNLCIACNQIEKQILEKEQRLIDTKKDKSKLYNILAAHAPRTDYCEESLYRYENNGQFSVMELIDRYFGLKLYGDKHTDNVHNFDYIVGAPLDEKIITCGIHQFDTEYHYHHQSVVYSDNKWKLVGSERDIEEILEISIESVKKQALEYLFGTRDVPDLADKIKDFEIVRSGENWASLDKLIRAYADIQKPQSTSAGMPIDARDGFINTLTRIISDSSKKVSITLRGRERVGKSVCMSLLYLNLLHSFVSGVFEFMPVYIDLEQIMAQVRGDNRDCRTYTNKLKRIFSEKLKQGIKLAERLQRPTCCIIDGINKFYIYREAKIEEMVANEVEGEYGKKYAHYIYCIDTGKNTGLGLTPQHTRKDAEYVVYFKSILTQKVNSRKKYRTFIKAYCALKDTTSSEEVANVVLSNIERMQIPEVDTSLLTNFWNHLCIVNEETFFDIIDQFVCQRIETREMANAAEACFLYHIKGESYTEIKNECKISNSVFELIRTQKLVSRYLLAANYVYAIRKTGKKDDLNDCLNILYNHEICALIRQYICKYNAQTQLLAFAEVNYIGLSFEGKATISYLLGRTDCERNKVVEVLDNQAQSLTSIWANESDDSNIYKCIARRSVRLSKMFTENGTYCECMQGYTRSLITDNYERKINRVFYLHFYGDRENEFDDCIYEGFDIYYTYNILACRLENWKNGGKRYTLLDLELFTLCDLLQIRLDIPFAKSSNGKDDVNSFFYNNKFNQPNDNMAVNILGFLIEIINCYLEQYGNTDANLIFNKYLEMQLKRFQNARDKLASGPLDTQQDAFAAGQLLHKLCVLGEEKRIGWGIADVVSETISEDQMVQLRKAKPVHETTLQHTFEAYLIGLLYLPSSSRTNNQYDKQKILNMLLIHDLGESVVGDIIPAYERYVESREKERIFCEELFLQGVHPNIANLSEYFFLWEAWCDSSHDDYNILIAREIDKIQMLYKMLFLLSKNRVNLTGRRIEDFWKAKNCIRTKEGKRIFNILIAQDIELKVVAEKHNLSVSELK